MPPEYLSYLGPVGRWVRAEVVDLDDGHSELLMHAQEIEVQTASDRDAKLIARLAELPTDINLTQVDLRGGVSGSGAAACGRHP